MSTIERSIDVRCPIRTVYNQWTQFESFPRFMEGVKEVRQLDDKRLHWRAEIGGVEREWDSEIIQQIPDQQIAWRSTTGPRHSGIVSFEPIDAERTRVTLRMEYDPKGFAESMGDFLGATERRVHDDMERFRKFIESRERETGEWRGQIHGGEVRSGESRPAQGRRARGALPARLWSQDPLAYVHQLSSEMDRLFDSFFYRDFAPAALAARSAARAWTPHVDIRERNGNLIVSADLPGLRKEDVHVEVGDGVLTIQGERREDIDEEHDDVRRIECVYGSFYRAVPLPEGVNIDKVEAHMENGVLEVIVPVPSSRASQARRVDIH